MLFNISLMLKYIFTWQKSQRVGISLCLFLSSAGTIEDGIRQILEFHVLNYFLARCEPFPFTKIKKKKGLNSLVSRSFLELLPHEIPMLQNRPNSSREAGGQPRAHVCRQDQSFPEDYLPVLLRIACGEF